MKAIELQGLTRCFKEKTAVDHVDLTIHEGELFALLGVNGAGKTTTIRMLCGLLRPDAGDALLLGHSITREPAATKALLNVSPQETAVAPNLTVRENLIFIAQLYGADKAAAKTKAQAMIDDFSLVDKAEKRAKTLSGGHQRRLSIAMALISEPKILFLDEPTLGLDVLARRELWQHIHALHGKVTIVLTTHYLEEAEALADRIGVMAQGRLTALGTAQELIAQTGCSTFEEAFVALAAQGGVSA